MKFCKDCKHGQGKRCGAIPDPVTGGENHDNWRANKSLARDDGWLSCRLFGTCGKEARFFVPLATTPEGESK